MDRQVQTTTTRNTSPGGTATPQRTPAERQELIDAIRRAEAGDQTAMAVLTREFDRQPSLWEVMGNVAVQAEAGLILACAGDNLAFREAIRRTLARMRADLAGPEPSPLERLLVDRVVSCWLALSHAEAMYHQSLATVSLPWAEFHQRRIDRAHRRYLSAIRTLATVRGLAVPALQVSVGARVDVR